jgi:hypothetical protein
VARALKERTPMTPYSLAVDLFANGISPSEVGQVLRRMGVSDSDARVAMAAARSAQARTAESEPISEPEPQYAAPPFEAPRWLRNWLTVVSAFMLFPLAVNFLGIWVLLHRDVSPMFWGAVLAQQAYFLAFIGGTVAAWKRRPYGPELILSATVLMVGSWICLSLSDEPVSLFVGCLSISVLVAYFKEWWSQRY